MKYIKKFKHEEEFNAFKDSDKYVTPNVSYIHGVEKSKLRKNVKFKIKDKECNAGADMTWEEWSKQANVEFFGNQDYKTDDGKVFNTNNLYIYKELPSTETIKVPYETKNNPIIPQHVYDLYDDPDKVIFYTSTDGNIVKPSNSNLFGGAKLLSNEYKDGLGRMVFDKKITSFDTIDSGSNQSDFPFSTRKTLKSIWIPDSVERINAFGQSCDALETIVFGKNVTYIGEHAFNSSDSLTNVIFGENLVEIAPSAFRNCNIQHLVFPNSLKTIGDSAFGFNYALETVTFGDGLEVIGQYAFTSCTNLSNLSFGRNIIEIATSAFAGCKMQHLVLPNSLKIIENTAFCCNSSLETVTFGNGIETMASNAFKDCGNLQYLYGPNTTQDNKALITKNGVLALVINKGLKTYTIPSNVKEIGEACFSGFTSLTSITIGEGVEKIGDSAFYGCDGLTTITIPSTVVEIGDSAFTAASTDNKTGFYGKFASEDNKCLIVNGVLKAVASKGLTEFHIPNGVTAIGANVFYGLKHLKKITIPDGVLKIGAKAFAYCNFTEITLPSTIEEFEDRAFFSTKLTSITLPNSVKKIGTRAFQSCQLTEITLGENIEWICYDAFTSNTINRLNITSLEKFLQINYEIRSSYGTPSPLLNLVNEVYLNGEKLTDVVIPETITEIKPYTFYGAKCFDNITINCNLKGESSNVYYGPFSNATFNSITIGPNVTYIGEYALYRCNLEKLICRSMTPPTIVNNTFSGMVSGKVLYYPLGADYSSWMQKLGGYGWTSKELYTPTEYYDLAITANDVSGRATKTSINWTCMSNGVDTIDGTPITGIQLSGTAVSNEFPQNLSETEAVEREITFEYQGLTATTTITQGVWVPQNYEVVLNDNWEKSTTITNPDEGLYDGVYQSFSNKGKDNTAAIMYIDIVGYENFKFYIRSYGESSYDYVMVSQLDMDINNNTSYSDTSLVKAHTRSKQQSGTAISNYTLVEFTGLDAGAHRITVVYRKDGSSASGDDRGYVLIPFEQ